MSHTVLSYVLLVNIYFSPDNSTLYPLSVCAARMKCQLLLGAVCENGQGVSCWSGSQCQPLPREGISAPSAWGGSDGCPKNQLLKTTGEMGWVGGVRGRTVGGDRCLPQTCGICCVEFKNLYELLVYCGFKWIYITIFNSCPEKKCTEISFQSLQMFLNGLVKMLSFL